MMYVIQNHRGLFWLTSRGFIANTPAEATKYDKEQEAKNVIAFCCRDECRVVRV